MLFSHFMISKEFFIAELLNVNVFEQKKIGNSFGFVYSKFHFHFIV